MPGVLYGNLNNVMMSIKNLVIFICFTIFHSRILKLFMRHLGTLNIANFHTQH